MVSLQHLIYTISLISIIVISFKIILTTDHAIIYYYRDASTYVPMQYNTAHMPFQKEL